MRRAARRDASEADIVAVLRAAGASVDRISAPGVPDLLIGYGGFSFVAECKTAKGKLTDEQQEWARRWRGPGLVILRTVEDALEFVRYVQQQYDALSAARWREER